MINRTVVFGAVMIFLSLLAGLAFGYRRCWSDTCKAQSKPKHHINIKRVLDKENVVPVLIIGSGPAALSAALYTARGGIDTWLTEGPKPGGLLMDTTEVENWPGTPSIMGPELMSNMKYQLTRFKVHFIDDVVKAVDFHTWPYRITLQDGSLINAMSVIIATGAKPKLLGVAGETKYMGHGVSSCATCDAPFFKKDENVVVVGGGDSAVEEAVQLAKHVNQVTILVRKEKMRAASSMQDRLRGYKNITVKYNLEMQEIVGDGTKVTSVKLMNHETGEIQTMDTAGVFLAIGHDPSSQVFKGHIDMCPMGHIQMFDRTQGTSVAGVFAAGDVEDSRYRQAIVAAGHGVSAALDAIEFLNEIGFDETVSAHVRKQSSMLDRARPKGKVVSVSTAAQFEELIAANKVVVADFFADYCPSCMQMLPVYDAVSADFEQVVFAKIDANTGADIMQKYSVNKVPYLLVFKDEALAARYRDTMSKKELHDFVEQFVA